MLKRSLADLLMPHTSAPASVPADDLLDVIDNPNYDVQDEVDDDLSSVSPFDSACLVARQ